LNKRSNQDICYEIETVENGLEAVQIASSRPYNVIFMDCNMPIMDGWQVRISERNRNTKRLRNNIFLCIMLSYVCMHVSTYK
jgi:CheY-like chemotaxis protein